MLQLECGSATEMGRRSSNEDAVYFDPGLEYYVVCDGTRGRYGGRTAAQLAVQGISQQAYATLATVERIDGECEARIDAVVAAGHNAILSAQAADPSLSGMTTTFASVLHRGSSILVSHVGDTRVYLCRQGSLQQLTVDHNLENYMRENPSFRPKMKVSGKTLVAALGLKQTPPRLSHLRCEIVKDDLLLISTDGLTDSLPPPTLTALLGKLQVAPVEDVVQSLTRAALNHGSMDNISVILLHASDRSATDGPKTAVFEMGMMQDMGSTLGWLAFLDEPHKGRVLPLEASTVIGADHSCKVVLGQDHVSARHVEVFRTEHGFVLRDLDSTNGTFINNIKVERPECLVDGDIIRVGRVEAIFKTFRLET